METWPTRERRHLCSHRRWWRRVDPRDIGSDVLGFLIVPAGEPVYAGSMSELDAEETECVHMCLDDALVPRADENGAIFSLWGRVKRFKYGGPNDDNGMQLPTPGNEGA
jgi:hypothetical protein